MKSGGLYVNIYGVVHVYIGNLYTTFLRDLFNLFVIIYKEKRYIPCSHKQLCGYRLDGLFAAAV